MSYQLLREFLLKAALATPDTGLQRDMVDLLTTLPPTIDREIVAPELEASTPGRTEEVKGVEDLLLQKALPELERLDPQSVEVFGKSTPTPPVVKTSMWELCKRAHLKMSAYIKDVRVKDLPEKVQEDVRRFISKGVKNPIVIHYGMMSRELLDRVDPQNFKAASEAVNRELAALPKDKLAEAKDAFFKKAQQKYILLVNDQIVDGHHFLAKARYFDITSSLNVLDLTPARFQTKD